MRFALKSYLFILGFLLTSIGTQAHVDSMRVYMPFYGTMNDWSGWNNNGNNPNPLFTQDRNNTNNRAMLFDGSNTHVTVSTKLFERQTFTYSLWMQLTERPDSNGMVLFDKGYANCGQTLSIYPGNGDSVYLDYKLSLANGDSVIRFPAEIPNLTWHHIGVIKSNDSVYLYFNMLFGTEKYTPGTVCNNGDSLRYGAKLDGSRHFKGRLDELRVYVENIQPSELFSVFSGERLSIGESRKNSTEIFPNPATNYVEIQSSSPVLNSRIYSNIGALVYESGNSHRLDLEQLDKGVYHIEIRLGDGSLIRKKLIIHH